MAWIEGRGFWGWMEAGPDGDKGGWKAGGRVEDGGSWMDGGMGSLNRTSRTETCSKPIPETETIWNLMNLFLGIILYRRIDK